MDFLRAWWFWSVFWLLTVFTLVGSGLTIYLIVSRRRLHTTPNWFLLSLSLAYFGVGLTFLPTLLACEMWISCHFLLDSILSSLRWYFQNTSVTNLCALVFDSYIAIVKPLTYRTWMKKSRVYVLIATAWVTPLSLPIYLYVVPGTEKPPFLFNEVVGGVFIVTTVHVLIIIRRHWKHISELAVQLHVNDRTNKVQISVHNSSASRAIKLVVIFLVTYVVSYVFDMTLYIYNLQAPEIMTNPSPFVLNGLPVLSYFFTMINPAVHALMYVSYRSDIKKELRRFLRIPNVPITNL